MTNHDDGSSLLQTPPLHIHQRHSHHDVHRRRDIDADGHMHMHLHHHRQHNQHVFPDAQPPPEKAGREQDQDLRRRQLEDLDPTVTRVVHTISVIQYVDGTGSPLQASTFVSPPVTEVVDRLTGATLTTSPVDPVPSQPPPVPSPSSSSVVSPGSSPASYPHISSPASSSSAPPVPTTFLSSVTSSPSFNSSALPSLSSSFNSSSLSAPVPFSNSTLRNFFANSSTSSRTSLSTWTTTSETSLTSSTWTTEAAKSTGAGIAGTAGGPFGPGGDPAPTGTVSAGPAATSQPPTPTTTIVGGVVGSICGVALLVFAAVFVLRWRKQHNGHRLLGDGDTARPGSADDKNQGFSNRMSQRGVPFSVPAALAALSGGPSKRSSGAAAGGAPETSERGFYRVSGRKLPSVLQHGGDGYTNPHDSTMSADSDMLYRDSQAFFGAPPTRLALGSPMRPESGVPVMQPGPARTPVTGQSPLLTPSPTMSPLGSHPPTPRRDPIGRSLPSMDGSRVSASRFTENMA